MKHSFRLLLLSAACSAFTVRLVAAPATPDVLREKYVAGLAVIADAQATASRTGHMLDLIESGADNQANRAAMMESRLLGTKHSAESFNRQLQSLDALTARLLEQKQRIETRFGTLDRALADNRALLGKSTEAVGALITSAEKSGSYVERTIAEEAGESLKEHARYLRDVADRLAQARQRIGLERTLFDGLQPRLAATANDLKALTGELGVTNEKVAKLQASLKDLQAALQRDRASLSKQHEAFGAVIEGFRVVQADVLRRWLLDGPPAGELPSLTIDDIVESGYADTGSFRASAPVGTFAADPNSDAQLLASRADMRPKGAAEADKNNQISAEFTQLHRRVRWLLAMLERLESFAEESLGEAEGWNRSANQWRSQLTNVNRSIADERGQLSSLQMEQDMVATTIKLIGQQASDTTGTVAAAVKNLGAQAQKLSEITADLKKLSGS